MCLISSKVLPEEMHARLEVRLRRGGLSLQRGLCGRWVGLTILAAISQGDDLNRVEGFLPFSMARQKLPSEMEVAPRYKLF